MTTFDSLDLIEPIRRALVAQGYEEPTPIQVQSIPALLDGRDLIGCARTGTGKTAAFALPILQRLADAPRSSGRRRVRALILSPTRELAAQIGESFATYGANLDLTHRVIFGGVNQRPQISALERGYDILVATPGRLLDLYGQGHVDLGAVEYFVLDEADRMLDMGFVHDIRRVLKVLPARRQNLLFSATMPAAIASLANTFIVDPVHVQVTPPASSVSAIEQRLMFVSRNDKRALLENVLREPEVDRTIVFTRTKHGANKVVRDLERAGIEAAAIHGNKSQNARVRALDGFRDGTIPVLVATDVASRGIDIDEVSHVINFDLPNEPESYVHRIGRTGRAGRTGVAISFCDAEEKAYLRDIERLTGSKIPVIVDHEFHSEAAVVSNAPRPPQGGGGRSGGQSGGGGARRHRPQSGRSTGRSNHRA